MQTKDDDEEVEALPDQTIEESVELKIAPTHLGICVTGFSILLFICLLVNLDGAVCPNTPTTQCVYCRRGVCNEHK